MGDMRTVLGHSCGGGSSSDGRRRERMVWGLSIGNGASCGIFCRGGGQQFCADEEIGTELSCGCI